MSIAIKEDMHKVLREVEQAVAAAQRDDWSRVERSLVEALGGIGTVLREIGLKRASPQLSEPPSPIKDGRE